MDNRRQGHERRKSIRRWIGGSDPRIERRGGDRRLEDRRRSDKEGLGPRLFLKGRNGFLL